MMVPEADRQAAFALATRIDKILVRQRFSVIGMAMASLVAKLIISGKGDRALVMRGFFACVTELVESHDKDDKDDDAAEKPETLN